MSTPLPVPQSKSKPVRAIGSVAAVSVVLAAGLPQLTPDRFDWIGAAVGLTGLCATAWVTYWTQTQVTPSENVAVQKLPNGDLVAGEASDIRTGAPVEVAPTTAFGEPFDTPTPGT